MHKSKNKTRQTNKTKKSAYEVLGGWKDGKGKHNRFCTRICPAISRIGINALPP